jgi:hypothetical protein
MPGPVPGRDAELSAWEPERDQSVHVRRRSSERADRTWIAWVGLVVWPVWPAAVTSGVAPRWVPSSRSVGSGQRSRTSQLRAEARCPTAGPARSPPDTDRARSFDRRHSVISRTSAFREACPVGLERSSVDPTAGDGRVVDIGARSRPERSAGWTRDVHADWHVRDGAVRAAHGTVLGDRRSSPARA